jgi:hypothetical protein
MKRLTFIVISILIPLFAACKPEIGDECTYDADCSANMDRYCDSSQPGGYCLIIGCGPDECPEEASCVNFTTPCPTGQGYEEDAEPDKCSIIEPNRGRPYCMRHCSGNGDCRSGYRCIEPEILDGAIIDFSGGKTKICVPDVT